MAERTLEPEVLTELDEGIRAAIVEQIDTQRLGAAFSELDTDDAVEIIEDLDEETQQEVLGAVADEDRALIEESLGYPDESAGRLMQRTTVSVPQSWTVGQVIDFMRETQDLPNDFYDLFVTDRKRVPIGYVPLNILLRTRRPVRIKDIMQTDLTSIPVDMDQEEVALLFRDRDLVSAPVVDAEKRLVGMITVDDIVDVIDEEAEEDLMRLAGVGNIDLYRATLDTTKTRFSWLLVNLGTAIVASLVIGLFEDSLARIVALAVLMPIVASMGGNAGTQTLTVAVRALAMRELTFENAWRFVLKEVLVGSLNGILFAILTAVVAALWFQDWVIGLIIGISMIVNLVVAGLAGTLIPLTLERRGIDPAVASSVLLTTVTDVVGFFTFLGLATIIIL
jgi:magnesium transporter